METIAPTIPTNAPVTAPTLATSSNGNFSAFEQARASDNAQVVTPTGGLYNALPKVSTTTISNSNKIDQVPSIINKTNDLSKTGVTTDAQGNATYANGTLVPEEFQKANPGLSYTSEDAQHYKDATYNYGQGGDPSKSAGGYIGDVYYAPGSPLPKGADGKPVATTATSPTDDQILNNLNQLKATNDSITASIIDSIHQQYANLIDQQKQTNTQQEAGVNNSLLMGGVTGQGSSAQYAPVSSAGIMQAQISYGLSQIADLTSKENMAVLAAQQAGQQNNFQVMDKLNDQISKIRDEKVAAATKLNDTIAAQNQKLADAKQQATKDSFVATEMSKGIKDPQQILKDATTAGLTISAQEIADGIKNLGPTADELNRQQAAIQFAIEKGITQPFYLVGNTAIDSGTGLPVSLADYQRATGQQVGLPEDQTDFSHIQHIADPQVQALMDKYIDAGIQPTDTLNQAKAKLGSSAIYRKETYIAPSSGGSLLGSGGVTTVGGNGIVAGVQVPTAIAGDVEDILSGRNTLYNIRQTMGRTNAAAQYMQSMRDAIHSIDPNFDFIASDAGGKFVSSTYYQKAAAAINSVMPNIDKIVDLSNQVSRVGVKGVDDILQKGAVQIGNEKVSNFREAQKLIADEIGVALGAGTVSDMKLQLGFDVTDPSVSPNVFASNMGIVKDFINNRLQGLKDQRYSSSVDLSGGSSGSFTVQAPDGNTYNFDSQSALDSFKKAAGLK